MDDELLVSATDIADLTGYSLSAVSNWRRRHATFPQPAERSPSGGDLFRLGEVRRWLESRPDRWRPSQGASASAVRLLLNQSRGRVSPDRAIEIAAALLTLRATGADTSSQTPLTEPSEVGEHLAQVARDRDSGRAVDESLFSPLYDPDGELVGELAPLVLRISRSAVADTFEELIVERHRGRLDHAAESRSTDSVADMLIPLAEADRGTIFDPAAGEGGFLLAAAEAARRAGKDPPTLIGQDLDPGTLRLARQRLLVHGLAAELRQADSIATTPPIHGIATAILCDPPYGLRLKRGQSLSPSDERWQYGLPPKNDLDLAWVQLAVHALRPGGRGCILLPNDSLFRGDEEARIRVGLLRANALEAIITLPAAATTATSVPVGIWVVRAPTSDPDARVLFIDAAEGSAAARRYAHADGRRSRGELAPGLVEEIIEHVRAWRDSPHTFVATPGVAAAIPTEELIRAEGDLVPSRWVGPAQVGDLDAFTARIETSTESLAGLRAQLQRLPAASSFHPLPGVASRERVDRLLETEEIELLKGRFNADRSRSPERREGIRVFGNWDLRGERPRFADPGEASGHERTDSGDIILGSRLPGAALVDHEGGAVVARPLQVLRIKNRERFAPLVVAAFLSSPEAARMATGSSRAFAHVRDLEIPVLDPEATRRLAEALDLLAEYARLGRETAEVADGLRVQLLSVVLTGLTGARAEPLDHKALE